VAELRENPNYDGQYLIGIANDRNWKCLMPSGSFSSRPDAPATDFDVLRLDTPKFLALVDEVRGETIKYLGQYAGQ